MMKKIASAALALLLILSLAACGNTKTDKPSTEPTSEPVSEAPFEWTRTGYFKNENDDLLYILPSEDPENPGWMVGIMSEDAMHGWYIQQEGETLHGDIVSPYDEGGPFVVTVSEEGEDGVVMTVEGGETYHFTSYEVPEAAFTVMVNIEGCGQIAYAEGEAEPEFDDEYPSQSAYIGLEGPETYTFAAKPDEGYKFVKWTYNGEDFSEDATVSFEVTEDVELIAVFMIAGTDEAYVDLGSVETIGELLGKPIYGTSATEGKYVLGFEQDRMIYRAVAEMPSDVSEAIFNLDWEDPDRDEKERELISPLKVISIDNLTEGIPSQEELDKLIGKTGAELFEDGWYNSGWNLYDMDNPIFFMNKGPYSFDMVMTGDIHDPENFEDEDINALVVSSVTFGSISNPTYLEEE